MRKTNWARLRGIVIPAGWQPDGEVSSVRIACYDEQVYDIANNRMGHRLRSCIQKRVIVNGLVHTTNNRMTIDVHEFRVDTSDPLRLMGQHFPTS